MGKLYGIFTFLVVFAGFVGCGPPASLDQRALAAYAQDPDHGLRMARHRNGYDITVQYRPQGLLVAQALAGGQANAQKQADLEKQYAGHYYFVVSIAKNNKEALYNTGSGYGTFSGQLKTLAFGMGELLHMATSAGDTIPLADHAFPRTFGLGSATQLLAVFDKSKAMGKEWVQINLGELGFGLGQQRFRFKVVDLEKAPKLKTNIKDT